MRDRGAPHLNYPCVFPCTNRIYVWQVRLNKKYYDEKLFLDAGIDHVEAYFVDGSVPPPNVLRQFIAACENSPGAVAVHCKVLLLARFRFKLEEALDQLCTLSELCKGRLARCMADKLGALCLKWECGY